MKYLSKNSIEESQICERFIKYAKKHSTSSCENADKGIIPSTQCQAEFARDLSQELVQLGFSDVCLTEHSYIYAEFLQHVVLKMQSLFAFLRILIRSKKFPVRT